MEIKKQEIYYLKHNYSLSGKEEQPQLYIPVGTSVTLFEKKKVKGGTQVEFYIMHITGSSMRLKIETGRVNEFLANFQEDAVRSANA